MFLVKRIIMIMCDKFKLVKGILEKVFGHGVKLAQNNLLYTNMPL